MNYFEEVQESKLPSLWRVKAKSYFWTLLFGAVFFVALFSVRAQINVNFGDLMQPEDARMTVVWLTVVFLSVVFNKIYYRLNSEVFQSNTQTLRLINKKMDNLKSRLANVETKNTEIYDFLVTYADKTPTQEVAAAGT